MPTKTQSDELTRREAQILNAYKYLGKAQGIPPTQVEVARSIGCDQSLVCRIVQQLIAKGRMRVLRPGVPRALVVISQKKVPNVRTA